MGSSPAMGGGFFIDALVPGGRYRAQVSDLASLVLRISR